VTALWPNPVAVVVYGGGGLCHSNTSAKYGRQILQRMFRCTQSSLLAAGYSDFVAGFWYSPRSLSGLGFRWAAGAGWLTEINQQDG